MELIDKERVEEILRNLWKADDGHNPEHRICYNKALQEVQCELDTIEVKDPYEECIQYDSINAGIQRNAEVYSFNIESELFNQLTKEQQGLWKKEIEQAYIIGGNTGVEFARDPRYEENLKAKEIDWVDMDTLESHCYNCCLFDNGCKDISLCKRPTSTFKGFYVEKNKTL